MSSLVYREPEVGAGSCEIRKVDYLPAVTSRTANSGALALSLDNVGGVRLGNAARCRCNLGSAGDDVGVVGPGLGDHSASLAVVRLGDGLVASGNASLGSHVWLGFGNYCGASLNIINQDCSGNDRHLGCF